MKAIIKRPFEPVGRIIDHGQAQLEDCLEANILRFKDGFVLCPIIWSGGECEECYRAFTEREQRYE